MTEYGYVEDGFPAGRVEDLGGTAVMESGSWGTEWELTVPLA